MPLRRINPGEELYNWLVQRYQEKSGDNRANSWMLAIARDFSMDELGDYLFKSTVYMVLRRLLASAAWYEELYQDDTVVTSLFEKDYLLGVFGFGPEDRKYLRRIVFSAYDASKKNIAPNTMKTIRDWASATNQRCHISGCVIDYAEHDPNLAHRRFTLDHIWPRSLGGVSEEWNLRVACKSCNQIRQNTVDESDAHYEHFHVKVPDSSPSFLKELHWSFRIAALAAANHQCQMCSGEVRVQDMASGPQFLPKTRQESLNMFNVVVGCERHRK